jgi:hypothetical protein
MAGQAFAAVAAAVTQLSEGAISKMSVTEERANTRTTARAALRDRLEAINRTARVVGRDTPGLEGKFRLPRAHTDQAFITAGRLFARDVEALEAQFIAHAMPKTFVADLNNRIEKLEQAIQTHEAGRDERTAARVSIKEALSSGTAAAERLDVIVANHLHDDPIATAVWKRDRRTEYPPRARKTAAEAPASTPSAPAPVASTPAAAATPAAPTPSATSGVTSAADVTS